MELILTKCKCLVLSLLFVFTSLAVTTAPVAAYSSHSSYGNNSEKTQQNTSDSKWHNNSGTNTPVNNHSETNPNKDCVKPTPKPVPEPPKHQDESKKATIVAQSNTCVTAGQKSGSVTVTITNPNTKAVEYTLTLGNKTQKLTVQAGQSGNVVFTDLTNATYSISIKGSDCTCYTVSATVPVCPPTPVTPPVGRGGGEVLTAATTTPVATLANTGVSTLTTTVLSLFILVITAGIVSYRPKTQNI